MFSVFPRPDCFTDSQFHRKEGGVGGVPSSTTPTPLQHHSSPLERQFLIPPIPIVQDSRIIQCNLFFAMVCKFRRRRTSAFFFGYSYSCICFSLPDPGLKAQLFGPSFRGLNRLLKNTGVRVEFVESTPQGLKPVLI
jgi:hypothetical protein